MAEAILRRIDSELEIYSAGLEPVDHVSPVAIEVMNEIGIDLQPSVPKCADEFIDQEFDYLITVGEGTQEELNIPPIRFRRKMHLGFCSPYKNSKSHDEIREKCIKVRDELMLEMRYFYDHMLKPRQGMIK